MARDPPGEANLLTKAMLNVLGKLIRGGRGEALAAQPIILDAGKVQMVSASADAITAKATKPLVFRFQARSTQWGLAGAKVMDSLKLKNVSIPAQQNPFVIAMIEPFKAEMAKRGGKVINTVRLQSFRP